jgi:hypothetical protein
VGSNPTRGIPLWGTKMVHKTPANIARMFNALERPSSVLTEIELRFLNYANDLYLDNGDLSDERFKELKRIWQEKGNPC